MCAQIVMVNQIEIIQSNLKDISRITSNCLRNFMMFGACILHMEHRTNIIGNVYFLFCYFFNLSVRERLCLSSDWTTEMELQTNTIVDTDDYINEISTSYYYTYEITWMMVILVGVSVLEQFKTKGEKANYKRILWLRWLSLRVIYIDYVHIAQVLNGGRSSIHNT